MIAFLSQVSAVAMANKENVEISYYTSEMALHVTIFNATFFGNICCIKKYNIDLQLKKLQQIDHLIYESDKYGHLFRMDGQWLCLKVSGGS